VPGEHARDLLLGDEPDDAIDGLSALEQDQTGNAGDLVATGDLRVLIRIQLDEFRLIADGDGTTGASIRHGPHHGAQKSTRTGVSLSRTWSENVVVVTSGSALMYGSYLHPRRTPRSV